MLKTKFYIFSIISLFFFFGCERSTNVNVKDDGFPPAVPSGLNVYAAYDGEVGIEWNRNSDADLKGYNIYRKMDSTNFKKTGFTSDIFFVDDSLDYNKIYFYQITAVDNSGKESIPSNSVSAKPINIYKPLTPNSLDINAKNWENNISIYLSWNKNFETDIAGYNIYRNTNSTFEADNLSLIGFSNRINYTDTFNLSLYKEYFYKIRTVDKGGLLSKESSIISDKILGIPEIIFPEDNAEVSFFSEFMINGIKVPANYKIIVQTNQFFGEFWSTNFFSSIIEDTIKIKFNPPYIDIGKIYYWRIATFSAGNPEPNSVSKLYKFIIKP